jgi:hypothetical protein
MPTPGLKVAPTVAQSLNCAKFPAFSVAWAAKSEA